MRQIGRGSTSYNLNKARIKQQDNKQQVLHLDISQSVNRLKSESDDSQGSNIKIDMPEEGKMQLMSKQQAANYNGSRIFQNDESSDESLNINFEDNLRGNKFGSSFSRTINSGYQTFKNDHQDDKNRNYTTSYKDSSSANDLQEQLLQYKKANQANLTNYNTLGTNQWSYSLDREDEENTPSIKKNNFIDTEEQKYSSSQINSSSKPEVYELKSLTREEADSTFLGKNSSASVSGNPRDAQVSLGPRSNTRSTMMGGTSYNNYAYSAMPLDPNPKFIRKSDNTTKVDSVSVSKSDPLYYDQLFEKAENESRKSKLDPSQDKIKEALKQKQRRDLDTITCIMQHGDAESPTAHVGKKVKSRIGAKQGTELMEKTFQSTFKKNEDPAELLNNEQSLSFQDFMEKRYDKNAPLSMVSQFGQRYMLEQQIEAQERKTNKLSRQLVIDPDHMAREAKDAVGGLRQNEQIQKQIADRKQRKKNQENNRELENEGHYEPGEGLGKLTSTYFTEQGRQEQEIKTQRVKQTDFSKIRNEVYQQQKKSVQVIDNDYEREEKNQVIQHDPAGRPELLFEQQMRQRDSERQDAQLNTMREKLQNISERYDYDKDSNVTIGQQAMALGCLQQMDPWQPSKEDTVHPNKFNNAYPSTITRPTQNLILESMNGDSRLKNSEKFISYNSQLGRGYTSSQLGYDAGFGSLYNQSGRKPTYQSQTKVQELGATMQFGGGLGSSTLRMQDQPGLPTMSYGAYPQTQRPQTASPSGYFYESASKYISLKKFSEELYQFEDMSSQVVETKKKDACSIYSKKGKDQPITTLRQWFESLLKHEKSISMTIIDQELVALIKSMYEMYKEYGHGTYHVPSSGHQQQYEEARYQGGYNSDRQKKIANFNILYKKPSYDYYGNGAHVSKEKEMQAAQEEILDNLRIVRVGEQDAITLSNHLLENTHFFFQILQKIDKNFLQAELKIEKQEYSRAMQPSVLNKNPGSQSEQQEPALYATSQPTRKAKNSEKHFFVLNERDMRTSSHDAYSDCFKQKYSTYKSMAPKSSPHPVYQDILKDKSSVNFAQMLSHIFEKAINVQYHDYQNKLSKDMKDFFFCQQETLNGNLYEQDLKLAKFWRDLKQNEIDGFWSKIADRQEEIIKELKQNETFKKINNLEDIQEEEKTTSHEREAEDGSGHWIDQIPAKAAGSNKQKTKSNLGAHKLSRDYLNAYSSKDESSDDIEKGRREKQYYEEGYRPLTRRITQLKQPTKGVRALDEEESDGSHTVTENSEEDHRIQNSIYSTHQDQQIGSERYNSDYEDEAFDDIDEQDDDFHLPKDHKQNAPIQQTTIKPKIQEIKKNKKQYQDMGSQATNMMEEEKRHHNQRDHKKAQAQITLSKEMQKENKLKLILKQSLEKTQQESKAAKMDGSLNACYLFVRSISTNMALQNTIKKNLSFYHAFNHMTENRLFTEIHTHLLQEQQNKKMQIIDPNPTKSQLKKQKKAQKKLQAESEAAQTAGGSAVVSQPAAVNEPSTAEQPVTEEAKKSKKAKRKNKKKKGQEEEAKQSPPQPEEIPVEKSMQQVVSPNANSREPNSQPSETIQRLQNQFIQENKDKVIEFRQKPEQVMVEASDSSSCGPYRLTMQSLEVHDKQLRMNEDRMLSLVKNKLFADGTFPENSDDDSVGERANEILKEQQLREEQRKATNPAEKYIKERTGLISGKFQNKYSEDAPIDVNDINLNLDEIGQELNDAPDLKMFNPLDDQDDDGTPLGVRKRRPAEIAEAVQNMKIKEQKRNECRQQIEDMEDLRGQHELLVQSLDELNDISKKGPEFRLVDLKQQRKEEEEKEANSKLKELNKLQREYNQKQNDYIEKVKEDAVTEEQTQEGEKKKKKKRKKNKKKKAGETSENKPAPMATETISEWQAELDSKLKEESKWESDVDEEGSLFDDEYYHKDEKHTSFISKVEQIARKKQQDVVAIPTKTQLPQSPPKEMKKEEFKVDLNQCKKAVLNDGVSTSTITKSKTKSKQVTNTKNEQGDIVTQTTEIQSQTITQEKTQKIDGQSKLYDKIQKLTSSANQETTQYCQSVSQRLVQQCIESQSVQINTTQAQIIMQQQHLQINSSDPVIKLSDKDATQEFPATEVQKIPQIENQEPAEEVTKPEPPAAPLSKKKQAKQDKKQQAKQNLKLKAQEKKQKEAEQKAQKQQQKKEIQQKIQKQKEEEKEQTNQVVGLKDEKVQNTAATPGEETNIQDIIQPSSDVKMPGLDELNNRDRQSQGSGSVARQPKRVKFSRDTSYDVSKVPKRGSSRGTSLCSSHEEKKEEAILNDLDGLFATEYVAPKQSTTKSISDALGSSKRNSPAGSNTAKAPEDIQDQTTQAKILNKKIASLQNAENMNAKRSASTDNKQNQNTPQKESQSKKNAKSKSKKKQMVDALADVQSLPQITILKPDPPSNTKPKETTGKKKGKKGGGAEKQVQQETQQKQKVKQEAKVESQKQPTTKKQQLPEPAVEEKKQKQVNEEKQVIQKVAVQESSSQKQQSPNQSQQLQPINNNSQSSGLTQIPQTTQQQIPQFQFNAPQPQQFQPQQQFDQQQQMLMNSLMPGGQQFHPQTGLVTTNPSSNQQQQPAQQNSTNGQQQQQQQPQSQTVSIDIISIKVQQNVNGNQTTANADQSQQQTLQQQQQQQRNNQQQQQITPQNFGQQFNQNFTNFQAVQPMANIQGMMANMNNFGMSPNFQNMQQMQFNFQNMQNMQNLQNFQNMMNPAGQVFQQPSNPNNFNMMAANFPQVNQANNYFQNNPNNNLPNNGQNMFNFQTTNFGNMNPNMNMGFQNTQIMPSAQQNAQGQFLQMQQQRQPMFNQFQMPQFYQQQNNQDDGSNKVKVIEIADQINNYPQMYQQQFPHTSQMDQSKFMGQGFGSPNFKPQQRMQYPNNAANNAYPHGSQQQQQQWFDQSQQQQQQQMQQQNQILQQMIMNQNNAQQIFQKVYQLQMQGYVMNEADYSLLQTLNLSELQYVHEFYEVLDAQVLKVKADQESKLSKTNSLRMKAFANLKKIIRELYSNKYNSKEFGEQVRIEIYGSMATGLAIDSSDLDMLVSNFIHPSSPRFHQLSRQEMIEEMQLLYQAVGSVDGLQSSTLIDSASVPVIKLQINLQKICEKNVELDEETKVLNVDITLDEPRKPLDDNSEPDMLEHLGLQCCKYIKQRIEEYPELKILALLLKKFLSLKNLNKPFSGGLSSYSLIQMAIAILKQRDTSSKPMSVGMLFKQFLFEFGFKFQPLEKGISQDGQIREMSEFNYIFHNPTCNINQWTETTFAETGLDRRVCTCGYTKLLNKHNQSDKVEGDGTQGGDLMHLLQRLINNQAGSVEDQQETVAMKRQQIQPSHYPNQPQLMIIDPLNQFNNIGKSSYNFPAIQQELRDVYQRLNSELINFVKFASNRGQQPENDMMSPDIDGLIPRILHVDYKIQMSDPIEVDAPIQVEEEKKVVSPVESIPPQQQQTLVAEKPKGSGKNKKSAKKDVDQKGVNKRRQ